VIATLQPAGHGGCMQRASWIKLGACSWLFCIVRFPCLLLLSGWLQGHNMQIFLLQAASQLDQAGCLFLAVLHRTISLPSAAFWLAAGWLRIAR
jgi:hypothetical protein